MAKYVFTGEMRTRVRFQTLTAGMDADGYPTEVWTDVFPELVWCKWITQHGSEMYESMRLKAEDTGTITMRYTPLVDARCRVLRDGDDAPFEVITTNDVEGRHKLLEIFVRRAVKA